jgi:hypothetical protein
VSSRRARRSIARGRSRGKPRVARATRGKQQNTGIGQSWYRLKSVFGVILLNNFEVQPTKSRIPDQGLCVFTSQHAKNMTHTLFVGTNRLFVSTPRVGHILRFLRVSILSADDFFLRLSKTARFLSHVPRIRQIRARVAGI